MEDKARRMKANTGDKTVSIDCSTCEFNFGNVCAGHGTRTDNGEDTYGMAMDEAVKCFNRDVMTIAFHWMHLLSRRS